jgi:hypothetical protein
MQNLANLANIANFLDGNPLTGGDIPPLPPVQADLQDVDLNYIQDVDGNYIVVLI